MSSGYTGEGWMAVVPTVATAKVDINIVPNLDHDDILVKIRKHLDTAGFQDVEIREVARGPHYYWALPGDPFLALVTRALRRVWGKDPVLYPSIGPSSGLAGIFMEKVGIPHFLMVPFGQPDMNEHSPQESLDIDFFMNGIKVTAATIDEFSRSDIGH
jgi:acetylornithine deacetylase/succinyl-diaminopimelate desuccinylase-like protein